MRYKQVILSFTLLFILALSQVVWAEGETPVAPTSIKVLPPFGEMLSNFGKTTGIYNFLFPAKGEWTDGIGRILMIVIGLLLLFLAIRKEFEPLILVPMGFGCILANIPVSGLNEPGGILCYVYEIGIKTGVLPLLVFMGIGALSDFGPMIAHPKTAILGAAAQFGIFTTIIGSLIVSDVVPQIHFNLLDAASIGIIGGADGPTAIFLSSQLSPRLLGTIAIAAYSYMALVPVIQPPIMRLFTTREERKIRMEQLRYVGEIGKNHFPLNGTWIVPPSAPFGSPPNRFFYLRQPDEGVWRGGTPF